MKKRVFALLLALAALLFIAGAQPHGLNAARGVEAAFDLEDYATTYRSTQTTFDLEDYATTY